MMLLPVAFYIIYAVTHGLNEYWDFSTNLQGGLMLGLPCLLGAGASWLWPRRGGIAAVVLSLSLLIFSTFFIAASKAPAPSQGLRPSLSFTDISIWILPYAILLIGSILALASAKEATGLGLPQRTNVGTVRVNKLRKTALVMMLLPGALFILFFIILIGISGDMIVVGNLFMGFLMGSMYGGPLLLLTAAAWRWPLPGSAVAIGLSIAAIAWRGVALFSEPGGHPFAFMFAFMFLSLMIIFLIGSVMVLISRGNSNSSALPTENKEQPS